MRPAAFVLAVIVCLFTVGTLHGDESPIWTSVAERHGLSAWKKISSVKFTWKHIESGRERSYDWNRRANTVKVTMGGETIEVPTSGRGLEGDELAVHRAFINDSYWFLIELKAVIDDVDRTDLGLTKSPFGGKTRAYRIQYGDEGGYTPGDAYVIYVGSDGRAVGWSYFPGGGDDAKMTTLRGGLKTSGGVTLPTRFETPDGELVIEISDFEID